MKMNNYITSVQYDLSKYFPLLKSCFEEIHHSVCRNKNSCTSFLWNVLNYKVERPRCSCVNKNKFIYHSPRGFGIHPGYFNEFPKYSEVLDLLSLFPSNKERVFRFIVNQGSEWPIHKDKHNGQCMHKQLMLPISNCNFDTVTSWYNLEHGTVVESSKVILLDTNFEYKVNKVHEACLIDNTPAIIDVGSWHNVKSISNKMRLVVGLYLD